MVLLLQPRQVLRLKLALALICSVTYRDQHLLIPLITASTWLVVLVVDLHQDLKMAVEAQEVREVEDEDVVVKGPL